MVLCKTKTKQNTTKQNNDKETYSALVTDIHKSISTSRVSSYLKINLDICIFKLTLKKKIQTIELSIQSVQIGSTWVDTKKHLSKRDNMVQVIHSQRQRDNDLILKRNSCAIML